MTARNNREAHAMLEQSLDRKPPRMPRRNRSDLSPLAAFIYGGVITLISLVLLVAIGGVIGWIVGGKP